MERERYDIAGTAWELKPPLRLHYQPVAPADAQRLGLAKPREVNGTKRSWSSRNSQKPCFETFVTSTAEVRLPSCADFIFVLLNQPPSHIHLANVHAIVGCRLHAGYSNGRLSDGASSVSFPEVPVMLFASLILSGILLLIACTGRTGVAAAFGAGFTVLGFLGGGVLPGFLLSMFIVLGFGDLWRRSSWKRAWFGPAALGGVVAAHGLVGLLSLGTLREEAELRALYPYESMEDRLPREPVRAEPLPVLALARLSQMEEAIDWEAEVSSLRVYRLKMLHEDRVSLFVNSPGFGVGRFLRPSVGSLRIWNERRPISQTGEALIWSPGEFEVQGEFATNEGLINMHDKGVVDFAYPAGFGYAKDRRHVAGFISHQFAQAPTTETWQLQRLDLVGLLLHDNPVAYVSEHLPRMNELREAPTRELDLFEAVGLQVLRQGEDLFVRGTEEKVRMLGALRAAKQCVTCHGGQRGDLLGAFSYTLRRTER